MRDILGRTAPMLVATVIALSALYTSSHLNDRAALAVLVPGVSVGLLMILQLLLAGRRRLR
jgi:hypothetical protein